jgi:5-oxoprolinase (ATP-hydrolysing) subunit B
MLFLNYLVLTGFVMNLEPRIYALSNTSLLIDAAHLDTTDVLAIQKKIWALTAYCKKTAEFTDLVPGMNSLTLYLKSAACLTKWQQALPSLWDDVKSSSFTPKHHRLATRYNGDDLAYIADFHGLSIAEVIRLHSQPHYHVLFLGFQPGFAYLHGLDERLHTPRRSDPRTKVPKGAVAIGAAQTGIYPADSPGGWHIIGHTSTPLFTCTNAQPCLLQPGDTLEFVVINEQEANHD